jgi:hypothetical protein
MEGKAPLDQAKEAIGTTLRRIKESPLLSYHMGIGSNTYGVLTEAASTLFNEPLEKVRRDFHHPKAQKGEPWYRPIEDDRMPDDNETVVLYLENGEVEVGYHEDGHWWLESDGMLPLEDTVLAWQSLPVPPEL